jgi:predicted CoA-binding protein
MTDVVTIRRALQTCRTIAVVGLSGNESRPSFFAAKYMQEHGYRVVPVNPGYEEILGEKCYASLLDIDFPIDMVDVFRRTEDVLPFAEQAVQIKAKCLWQQLAINNEQAHDLAVKNDMISVADHCMKIEFARLFGGLNWAGVNTKVISAKRPAYFANGPLPRAEGAGNE